MPAPGQSLPRRSGAHRIACITLYRALLVQCPKIPLPTDLAFPGPVNPIQHFIRKRFKKNAFHSSPRILIPLLKIGYAAETLLRSAASGNLTSLGQVHSILRHMHAESAQSRALPKPERKPRPLRPEPCPGAPKLLDVRPRPIEEISGGRRQVPVLAMAGPFPYLRIKKPQSAFLTRVLGDKLKEKQRFVDEAARLEMEAEMGEAEDMWDEVIERTLDEDEDLDDEFDEEDEEDTEEDVNHRRQSTPRTPPKKLSKLSKRIAKNKARISDQQTKVSLDTMSEKPWMAESFLARSNFMRRSAYAYAEAGKLGDKMLAIVDQERELFEKERGLRRHEKKQAAHKRRAEERAKKAAGEENGGPSAS